MSYPRPRRQADGSIVVLVVIGLIIVAGICGLPSYLYLMYSIDRDDKKAVESDVKNAQPLIPGDYQIYYPMHNQVLTVLSVTVDTVEFRGTVDTRWNSCVGAVDDLDHPQFLNITFRDGSTATLLAASCDGGSGERIIRFANDRKFGATFDLNDGTLGRARFTVDHGQVHACSENNAANEFCQQNTYAPKQ